ncbi:flippase-like domain-containing protein [Candidatus Thorarchaeota archaeon]|nr:MAG: flippase-like domain-containing protein [Candidatus Thorarchaeota archaeon]
MTLGEETTEATASSFISPRKIALFIIFSMIVFGIVGVYGDPAQVLQALSSIPWYWVLPVMMALSFLNYIFRYFKWQYYLNRIGVNLCHKDSFSVFLSGFTLTTTPGKIGEAVKGYFVNAIDGTPIVKTIPIVVSERVTDLLAMVMLALVGFTLGVNTGDQLITVILLGGAVLGGAIVLGSKTFYKKFLSKMTSFGPLKRFQDSVDIIEDTMTKTLSPKPLVVSTAISIPGWFMECLELWLLLALLSGEPLSLSLLLIATFIHTAASIIGALTFSPGGVGMYEITSIALIGLLVTTSGTVQSAATILIRVMTLWFSVIIGFIALGIVTRRAGRRKQETQQD